MPDNNRDTKTTKHPSTTGDKTAAGPPKVPADGKAPASTSAAPPGDAKSPAELQKADSGHKSSPAAGSKKPPAPTKASTADGPKAMEPSKPQTGKQTSASVPSEKSDETAKGPAKGVKITQVFADRLDKPDEKALQSLPIPKEGEGFSIRLHPGYFFDFLDHPFSINREVLDYRELYESIRDNGITEPVKARPRAGGGLELLSGHRRHDIARTLNYPVPAVIVQMDDDSARIEVVDGNLHRQDIPTSELARAAKMKMEALARKAGRRAGPDSLARAGKRTDQIVAEDMGLSRNQVNRLVRIDSLVPELKQQVDEKKLPFNTAVELSFLQPEEQGKVAAYMQKEAVVPTLVQATALKEASRAARAAEKTIIKPDSAPRAAEKAPASVDEKKIASIVKPKAEPEQKYIFTSTELREYFPGDRLPTTSEVKRRVFDALDLHQKALERQRSKREKEKGTAR